MSRIAEVAARQALDPSLTNYVVALSLQLDTRKKRIVLYAVHSMLPQIPKSACGVGPRPAVTGGVMTERSQWNRTDGETANTVKMVTKHIVVKSPTRKRTIATGLEQVENVTRAIQRW